MNSKLVDFSQSDKLEKSGNKMKLEEYTKLYDKHTTTYYKAYRIRKCDPIDDTKLTDTTGFKYKYIWDPYTGEIVTRNNEKLEDPIGPLYLDPNNIVQNIYHKRLLNLWITPSTDDDGFYEGYYGDSVGAGNTFELAGRGTYIERYLFRLPVIDCYLPPDHTMSLVTMGPILTDNDIDSIDKLMQQSKGTSAKYIYDRIGSLKILKKLYDIAISKTPIDLGSDYLENLGLSYEHAMSKDNPNEIINREAVDAIKHM